jgi:hypothetical protein
MSLSNIVDKLHNKHSLSDTGTTKQPDLSSPLVWCKQVNNLYENLCKNGIKPLDICNYKDLRKED